MEVVDLSMVGTEGMNAAADRIQTLAAARLQNSQAEEKEFDNQEEENIRNIMMQASTNFKNKIAGRTTGGTIDLGETGEETSALDGMDYAAEALSAAGYQDKGLTMFGETSEIRKREDEMKTAAVNRKNAQYDQLVKIADTTYRMFSPDVIKSQPELDANIARARQANKDAGTELYPEEILQALEAVGYDPNFLSFVTDSALSAKQRADIDMQKDRDQAIQEDRAARLRNAVLLRKLAERKQEAAEREATAKKKAAGAKGSDAPTPQQISSAATALKAGVFKDMEISTDQYGRPTDPQFAAIANSVVSRTKAIISQVQGISWEEAQNRAIIQGQADGSIKKIETPSKLYEVTGGLLGSKTKEAAYEPTKATLPLPATEEDMVVGQKYTLPNGKIVQWDGTQGVPVK